MTSKKSLATALIDNRYTRKRRQRIDRLLVASSAALKIYEHFANHKSMRVRHAMYAQSAKSLYGASNPTFGNDFFQVGFLGNRIKIPLRQAAAGFDWDYALSILGHDVEVKRVYEIYLEGEARARFFDIGANFGSHSALFLACGAEVHSFEPIAQCHAHFLELSRVNGWDHRSWHRIALSAEEKVTSIRYPRGEEWLATIVDEPGPSLARNVVTSEVELKPLDDLGFDFSGALIKIDVEGHELSVLQGFRKSDVSRLFGIVFESNTDHHRVEIATWAAERGFSIIALSMDSPENCSEQTFVQSARTNFFMGPHAVCEQIARKWSEQVQR